MTFFEDIRKLRQSYHDNGVDAVLYPLTWRLPKWLFTYTHAYLVTAHNMEVEKPDCPTLQFRLATQEDAPHFDLLSVSAETVHKRLAAGDLCGVAVRPDGKVCSMVWAATGRLYLKGVGAILDVDPGGVYVYNSFTLQELRGQSLYRGCSSVICDAFRQQDRTVRYGIIDWMNEPSFKANERIHLRIAGEAFHLTILFFNFTKLRGWLTTRIRFTVSIGRRTSGARVV